MSNVKIKREFRCYYEGLQEEKYFKHIKKIIEEAYPNVNLKFKKVEKLKSLVESSTMVPKIAVFDYDSNKEEFEKKVKICKNTKNHMKTKILYTSLNFDLWLLIHKKQFDKPVVNNGDYVEKVRNAYNLSRTANIKNNAIIEKMMQKIKMQDLEFARENARKIMARKLESDKILIGKKFSYYPNPSMNIHEFFNELMIDLKIDENEK